MSISADVITSYKKIDEAYIDSFWRRRSKPATKRS